MEDLTEAVTEAVSKNVGVHLDVVERHLATTMGIDIEEENLVAMMLDSLPL